jgi:hypothetical protein
MKKLTKKQVENLIDSIFYKHSSGIQFDIFDLSKISKELTKAYEAGLNLDETMINLVAKYRMN